MSDLITTIKTMTSIQIAELTGKQHKDILRDIRDESEKLQAGGICGERKFALSFYITDQNKELPCYELSREGVLQLAARYDAVTRAKLIEMAMRTEQKPIQITSQFMFQIAAQLEEKERENGTLRLETTMKDQVIRELKPKADYTDIILKNKGLVTITQISKDYGMSGNAMNKKLHELGLQYKQSDQWLLYTKYQDKGFTHSETINIIRTDGRPDVSMNTKWTQKGRLFIYRMLKDKLGIVPLIEEGVS
jgi:phage antirepressor YoqD-like protein